MKDIKAPKIERDADGNLVEELDESALEWLPRVLEGTGTIRVDHAKVLGKDHKARDQMIQAIAFKGVRIAVGDGEPILADTPEKRAMIHALARLPQKRKPKAKRVRGRPSVPEPTGDARKMVVALWGALSGLEATRQINEHLGCKVSRNTIRAWIKRWSENQDTE